MFINAPGIFVDGIFAPVELIIPELTSPMAVMAGELFKFAAIKRFTFMDESMVIST